MFHPQGPTLRELARQALSSTEQGYDLLAPKFDHSPFRTPDSVLAAAAGALGRLGPFESGLDLCCGTGAAIEVLRPHCRGLVVGLDRSRGMLEVARRCREHAPGATPLAWARADALALPFADRSFDAVVSFGAFGHFLPPDQEPLLGEVRRVLAPGGRFVFAAAPAPPPWSVRWWLGRGFNAAMHVRNGLLRPPFVMYYLTFALPDVRRLLERQGLAVEAEVLPGALGRRGLRLVTASAPRHRTGPARSRRSGPPRPRSPG